jgi:hypothetical protein
MAFVTVLIAAATFLSIGAIAVSFWPITSIPRLIGMAAVEA